MGRSQRHMREIHGMDSGGYVGEPPELPGAPAPAGTTGGTKPAAGGPDAPDVPTEDVVIDEDES